MNLTKVLLGECRQIRQVSVSTLPTLYAASCRIKLEQLDTLHS